MLTFSLAMDTHASRFLNRLPISDDHCVAASYQLHDCHPFIIRSWPANTPSLSAILDAKPDPSQCRAIDIVSSVARPSPKRSRATENAPTAMGTHSVLDHAQAFVMFDEQGACD